MTEILVPYFVQVDHKAKARNVWEAWKLPSSESNIRPWRLDIGTFLPSYRTRRTLSPMNRQLGFCPHIVGHWQILHVLRQYAWLRFYIGIVVAIKAFDISFSGLGRWVNTNIIIWLDTQRWDKHVVINRLILKSGSFFSPGSQNIQKSFFVHIITPTMMMDSCRISSLAATAPLRNHHSYIIEAHI